MNRLLLSLTLVYMLSLPATALRGVDGEPSPAAQKEATEGNWTDGVAPLATAFLPNPGCNLVGLTVALNWHGR